MIAYLVSIAAIILSAYQIVQALKTGKVGYVFGGRRRTRADDPNIFWSVIAFWTLVIAYFAYRMVTL
ncbi:hypothetical protein KYN89_12980 [Alteriqipengyuania sp. NZ-12B]|uniref:Uncharacterized protein n=1 Tax=Alteriqipengyuania abyssalis TaxID=2860200 RepID=A0ABS7PJE7_9SPHN|nr:hypothetical protein [Alteriqipengyuania abyssalis]MBY8337957.1 hypothetical protein [Alteriqipengyuania abyssalis]